MRLELKKVACGYGKRRVLHDISLSVSTGEVFCLLGPNGVGKTTLFKTILGFLPLQAGQVLLNKQDVRAWKQRDLAKAVGYVPQAHEPPFPYRVLDVVMMGRTVHMGRFAMPAAADEEAAGQALENIGVPYLRDKVYTEISGGERQMVLIARALAQSPKILVLDEPTANLDFGNQMRVLRQIKRLAAGGFGIIMTSHFPDHAFLCCHKVGLLSKGSRLVTGTADEVVTERNLMSAYGVAVRIAGLKGGKGSGVKACIPLLGA